MWQRTQKLRHPNLLELLNCGRAELAGEIALYAVFESPDDTLAAALKQSPLSEGEAREVLAAVVDGLGYLQAQGLAPGTLDPEHVVAVGDRIKLSTDALQKRGRDAGQRCPARILVQDFAMHAGAERGYSGASREGEPLTGTSPARSDGAVAPAAAAVTGPSPTEGALPAAPSFGITTTANHRIPKWIPVGAAAVSY